jgi:hypothetical protein
MIYDFFMQLNANIQILNTDLHMNTANNMECTCVNTVSKRIQYMQHGVVPSY